jgi:hypothetical protein
MPNLRLDEQSAQSIIDFLQRRNRTPAAGPASLSPTARWRQ